MASSLSKAHQMGEMFKRGADVGEIACRFSVQNPAVWKALRRIGLLPPYEKRPNGTGPSSVKLRKPKVVTAPPPRVDRDPCTYCGVRADVGCRHQRASR